MYFQFLVRDDTGLDAVDLVKHTKIAINRFQQFILSCFEVEGSAQGLTGCQCLIEGRILPWTIAQMTCCKVIWWMLFMRRLVFQYVHVVLELWTQFIILVALPFYHLLRYFLLFPYNSTLDKFLLIFLSDLFID